MLAADHKELVAQVLFSQCVSLIALANNLL
jgi:hypothetical protein